jgi:hypothetical protein
MRTAALASAGVTCVFVAGNELAADNGLSALGWAIASALLLVAAHRRNEIATLNGQLADSAAEIDRLRNADILAPFEHDHLLCAADQVGRYRNELEPLREAAIDQKNQHVLYGIAPAWADQMAADFYACGVRLLVDRPECRA